MTTVREIIKRDIGVKVEGVVKVFDRSSLASEVREYVVTDKIEDELKRQTATRRFAEEAEAFSNLVYEQPDSLQPAAPNRRKDGS